MAKNKLSDLNDHLFAQLERLNDENIKGEDMEQEIRKSKAVTAVAAQIVNNARVTLEAVSLAASGKFDSHKLPENFGVKQLGK
ncbi:hypothetical protein [Leeuwenhoekiella sp. ZYFB001]|uniref:hypothetical protein n=1 Tax=Leeuwenhoekiella sp. ZYFB001 TaxID=2719912 RepID=UPI00143084DF|nr:hypothetical protein [Leeuwenhoekiella sp. ZYFB001]